jgi:hypothetical protein
MMKVFVALGDQAEFLGGMRGIQSYQEGRARAW